MGAPASRFFATESCRWRAITSSARHERDQNCGRAVIALALTTAWPKGELRRIAETDDLHIAPFREDGVTFGTPTWIWSVAVDDPLYARAYNGTESRWYQAARRQKAGRIIAAGMTKEVTFEPVEGPINDRIDDAYRSNYAEVLI